MQIESLIPEQALREKALHRHLGDGTGQRPNEALVVPRIVIGHRETNREQDVGPQEMCLKARGASGQTRTTCSK